jgi:hypothetical protein
MNSTRKLIRALDPKYIEEDTDIPKLTAISKGISELLGSEMTDRGDMLAELIKQSRATMAIKGGKRKSTSKKMQAKYKSKTRSNKH